MNETNNQLDEKFVPKEDKLKAATQNPTVTTRLIINREVTLAKAAKLGNRELQPGDKITPTSMDIATGMQFLINEEEIPHSVKINEIPDVITIMLVPNDPQLNLPSTEEDKGHEINEIRKAVLSNTK